MSRAAMVETLISKGVVAVIRMQDPDRLKKVAEAICEGGITAIEITMTVPNALAMIEAVSKSMGAFIQLGVGTVLDAETARRAIAAGAQFVVGPVFKPEVIDMAHRFDVPAMPGCFSPTEIFEAQEHGADIIKVFPADVLGMAFFKAIKAPMPDLKLMPTGGVTLTNAGDWIKAGACAVGVGSALLDSKAIAQGQYSVLTENAKIICQSIAQGRTRM